MNFLVLKFNEINFYLHTSDLFFLLVKESALEKALK